MSTSKNLDYKKILVYSLLITVTSGCSIFASDKQAKLKEPEVYKIAFRQLPPEPVYNRVTVVRPPIIMPSKQGPQAGPLELTKILSISIANVPLEAVVKALAETSEYSSYTASSLATKKISLKSSGNIDQIAADIEVAADAKVFVDHANREIRVLGNEGLEPVEQTKAATKAKFALDK